MTKYKLPAVGDVVRTRGGNKATVVWIAPEHWSYRIWGHIAEGSLIAWTARGQYHEHRVSSWDLMLEPEAAPASFPASVKWLGPDGGWKTGEVAIVNDGGSQVPLLVDGAQLVRDITGALHLVPESDLQPWPKREEA